ncbi:MAG: hypothetical protein CMH64_03705 [Nanoarchaeota archaeon]|nr:hypothetical protein [Nanoarchaeota archaeon]|tara:strand:+ start:97 stop:1296 length:1200 start_codon:yes stop_codon:yes gene_type:complete
MEGYYCKSCKGWHPRFYGSDYCPLQKQFKLFQTKDINVSFSGASPPDIFVGKWGYPNVFSGILSPVGHDENSKGMSDPEEWFKNKLSSDDILLRRSSLVYSRFENSIKNPNSKLNDVMQEVSMASKACDVEFNLKKAPKIRVNTSVVTNPLGNVAPLRKAKISGNVKVAKKVDYFVDDHHLKAENAIVDLHKFGFSVSSMIKLLSSGLLGIKKQRKLVPSRWSTTAVDDMVSKNLLKKVKEYNWINDFYVFSDEYLGNHYEILLLPRSWSFEVIESKVGVDKYWQDSEINFKRKKYASDVTGAYYANRLAVVEFLNKIKKQASVIFFREIKDYEVPLGIGILREVSRNAFTQRVRRFNNLKEALEDMQSRLKTHISKYTARSNVIEEYKKQSSLREFIL